MRFTPSLAASLLAFALAVSSAGSLAEFPEPPRVALKGHDPVGYFTLGKPLRGTASISYDWDDSRYYFASTRHRDLFASDPERYAPRFSGWCAGAIAYGVKVEPDPNVWKIVDGKLYVFRSPEGSQLVHDEKAMAAAENAWRSLK